MFQFKRMFYESIVPGLAGISSGFYSHYLREMAKAGEISYTYWQGVGLHWGVGALFQSILLPAEKTRYLTASVISLSGVGLEIFDSFALSGVFAFEDMIGTAAGAFTVATYQKILDVSRGKNELKKSATYSIDNIIS